MKQFISSLFIFIFLQCSSAEINVESSKSELDKLIKESNYTIADIDLNQADNALYQLGKEYLNIKYDPLTAEKIFRYLVNKNPKNSEYLYQESRATFFIGEFNYFNFSRDPFDIALGYIDRALKIKPNERQYLLMKSYIIGRIGLHVRKKGGGLFDGVDDLQKSKDIINQLIGNDEIADESTQTIIKAINKDWVNVEAILTRAEIYKDSPGLLGGSKESAYKLLNLVLKEKPENLRVRDILGVYYREREEYQQSQKQLQFIVKQVENNKGPELIETEQIYILALRHMADNYRSLGQVEEGKKYIEKHLKRRPTSSKGYLWLAYYYFDKKDKTKAKAYADKALANHPYNEGAKELLEKLKNNE